ncbi:MAG: hypothetical protein ACRD82_05575 [Blastocatellia bacterium]
MLEQVLEGTWEEVAQHADELAGKHVRLTVAEERPTTSPKPNEGMLEVIRRVAEMQSDMPYTSGKDTLEILRRARAGEMYGYDPCE